MTTPLFVGGLGPMELGLIALVMILLFGASKLPTLARSMGSATGEFEKGRHQVEAGLERARADTVAEEDAAEPEPEAEPAGS